MFLSSKKTVKKVSMDFDDEKEADNSIDVDHPIEFCCPIGLDLMHDPVLLGLFGLLTYHILYIYIFIHIFIL